MKDNSTAQLQNTSICGVEQPKRIWLICYRHAGDICWTTDPDPDDADEIEAVEYVRADTRTPVSQDAEQLVERLLEELDGWEQAYPLSAFPEPDLKMAAALLKAGGMTLDAVSASNMRHVVSRLAPKVRETIEALTRVQPPTDQSEGAPCGTGSGPSDRAADGVSPVPASIPSAQRHFNVLDALARRASGGNTRHIADSLFRYCDAYPTTASVRRALVALARDGHAEMMKTVFKRVHRWQVTDAGRDEWLRRKRAASAIEARRAATENTGAVGDESATRKGTPETPQGDRWCAPGDDQKDRWLVRFNDPEMREALYSGPDAEREARAKWEAMCGPSGTWNGYLFRLAALPSPEREPMREALEGYRAAVSFISADSWDGCHDCIDILRAARSVDVEWDWAGNPDRIAAELKSLRRRAGMNGAPPDAALAPPTAQSGDRT